MERNDEEFITQKQAIISSDMTRERYERLCTEWGVPCHADAELGNYGDKYGDYWGIPYDAMRDEDVAYLRDGRTAQQLRMVGIENLLRQRRWFHVSREIQTAAKMFFADCATDGREVTKENLKSWLWFTCPAHLREHVAPCIASDKRFIERPERLRQIDRAEAKMPKCSICGCPTTMIASLGPACPEHYDECSG